ncbi:ribonuclease HII [Halovulum sp. GXIMD14794]
MTLFRRAPICGIDEAGRGPWAGPVVAAAVILDPEKVPVGVDDSKKLSAKRRAAIFAELKECAVIGIGAASVREIDRINILQASYLAMRRAVAALPVAPGHALIDGKGMPRDLPCPGEAIVGGDGSEPAISAASIVAKVTRDRIMVALSQQYPGYGWETNAGYGVKMHSEALHRLGVTPHHRRSFKPVHNILCQDHFVSH